MVKGNELKALKEAVSESYIEGTKEFKDYLNELMDSQDYIFYENMNMQDVVLELIHEGYFGEISGYLQPYVDIKSLADDLSDAYWYTQTDYGVVHIRN